MSELQSREAEVASRTVAENPEETKLQDDLLRPFSMGFELLKPSIPVEDIRLETTQLLAMASNALRWSHQQLVTGYYSPAVTMARNAFECWVHGTFLNLWPECLPDWKNPDKPRVAAWRMRKMVAERMEPSDEARRSELLVAMDELYHGRKGYKFSGFSVYAHPSWEALRILVASDDDGLRLRAGPDYDQGLFRNGLQLYSTSALFSASLFQFILNEEQWGVLESEMDGLRDRVKSWQSKLLATVS